MTLRCLVLATSIAVGSLAGTARADEERFAITLRGAAFNRDDGGYADHAQVFGLSNPEIAGGGVIEGGVRFLPRLWLLASWSGFSSRAPRRLSELSLTNRAVLGHLGLNAYREEFVTGELPWTMRFDLMAGAGLYTVSDDLDGESHRQRGPGARLGTQIAFGWRAVGLSISYGWHMTGVRLEDRLGGTIGAGGHEFGAGLRLQY